MMRTAKIVLAFLAGLVLLAFVALVVATLVIDPDSYRPTVQRELTRALGRDVSIERLSIARSLRPTIAVDGLRISNAPWASQPQLISVHSASVRLNLLLLIRGEIEIGSIDVDGVVLSLERDSNGVGNWVLPARNTESSDDEPTTLPDIDRISLRDVNVSWRNVDGATTVVHVPSLEATLRAHDPLQMNATVIYHKVPIRAQLNARHSLQSALAGEPVSASLALDAAQTHLDLGITLSGLPDFRHVEATVAANGERIGALSSLLDLDLPDWGPYSVSASLVVDDERIRVSELRLAVDGLPGEAPFAIRRIRVRSGLLSFGSDIPTTGTLSGSLDDMDFVLDATSANISSFGHGFEHLPLDASMRVSGLQLGADGEMGLSDDAFAFDFRTRLKGDTRPLARILGNVEMSGPLEVNLDGDVLGDQNQVRLSGLKGAITGCSVNGNLTVQYGSAQGNSASQSNGVAQNTRQSHRAGVLVDAELNLGRLDVAALDVFPKSSGRTSAKHSQSGPPAWMSALDADLRLGVGEILGLPVTVSDISGQGILSDGRLAVRKFRGSVNGTRLLLTAGFDYQGNRPHVDADISLPVLDLERLHAPAGGKKDGVSALDSALPITFLNDIDADLKVAIKQIKGSPVSAQRLQASAHLQRGHLQISAFDATTAGITLRNTLTLDASNDGARLRTSSHSDQIVLADVFKDLSMKPPVLGRLTDAVVTIDTHGTTLRNWLVNAKVGASVGASQLELPNRDEKLDIDQARIVAGPNVPVEGELRGRVDQYPLRLSATGGPLADLLLTKAAWPQISAQMYTVVRNMPVEAHVSSALGALRAGRDVPVRLDIHSANESVSAVGTIADMRKPERTPLDVEIRVTSLKRSPWKPGEMKLPDIPFSATGNVSVGGELITLDDLKLKAGETDFSGNVRLHRGQRLNLAADLSGNVLDLRPWIPKSEAKVEIVEKTEKVEKVEKATKSDPRMDQPFDLEPMRKMDVALTLHARRVISYRSDLDDLALNAKLNEGMLDVSTAIAQGGSTLKARVDGRTDAPAIAIRFKTKDLDFESLTAASTATAESSPKLTVNAQFASSGATPRKIYSSAKGVAVLSAGSGRINTSSASPFLLQTLSASLLEVLLPGRKPDDFDQLECAAARFEVKDGVANSPNGIALRFKRMDILGSGAVNLTTGKILFGFKAVRRRWFDFSILSIASDFASITGTVEKPRVGLDTQGVLITGGAAWATAGLSLLATNFLRTMSSSEDPCTAILEKGRTASDPIDALMKSLQSTSKP